MPASILEAGELFASRMRVSRALKQLWDVRESYMKFERGWEGFNGRRRDEDLDVKDLGLELSELSFDATQVQEDEPDKMIGNGEENVQFKDERARILGRAKETDDELVQSRLDNIENLYVSALSPFQWE